MSGYHIRNIEKGTLGELSKIYEEVEEIKDAEEQDVSVGHDVVPTDEAVDSYDLVSKTGIELGSYGVRLMLGGTVYTYGTGIAEPRLSYVKDNQL